MKTNDDDDETLIETRCKVCGEVTTHTVITEDDEEPTVIQCAVCDETQPYRRRKSLQRKMASSRRSMSSVWVMKKEKIGDVDYKKIIAKRKGFDAIEYEMTGSYKEEDLIDHSLFGIGFVRGTVFPNKIDVLFREGPKLLICARHPEESPLRDVPVSEPKKSGSHGLKNTAGRNTWTTDSVEKRGAKFADWEDEESS